jgi:hypothetical protein
LATKENIEILSEAIGIKLKVQDQERRVGPFRADILCKNTADNSLVLFENQFLSLEYYLSPKYYR